MAYVGLVRVSTDRQETQRQHDALDPICVRVYEETVSGGKRLADRPGLRAALDYLRPEDFLTVQEADRLGRNLLDGLITLTELFQRGIKVKILDGVAAGEHTERNLILDLALALAEDRRRDISRKTKNGLDAARKRGTKGGRPTVVTDDRRRAILGRRDDGESIRQIARGVGISPAVVHGVLRQAEPAPAPPAPHTDGTAADTEPPAATPQPAETATPAPASPAAALRAIGPRERIDPDTVTTKRNPDTGTTRVLATAADGQPVLIGFLDRHGRQWHAQTPHLTSVPGRWRTRQEALLRLVEPHARSQQA